MTGFGHGDAEADGFVVSCDVRAVNHRHLDVKVRLPRELVRHEPALLKRVRAAVGRGRLDVTVRCEADTASGHRLRLDEELVRGYDAALERIADALGRRAAPLSPLDAVQLDGVLALELATPGPDVDRAIGEAVDGALGLLMSMRRDEGAALATALGELLDRIAAHVAEVEAHAADQLPRLRDRLEERLRALLDETPLDPDRVLAEAAVVAERSDVTEELVRLRQHVEAFRQALRDGGIVGRKLDFLAQELLREANTLGSKTWEAPVSLLVIEIKSDVERVREQVQNIE